MFNQEFDCQNIFKRESSKIANTYFFPSKNQARLSIFLLHTKQESSKTTVAHEGSIKIETRGLTPKSSRSRISSKSCSSLLPCLLIFSCLFVLVAQKIKMERGKIVDPPHPTFCTIFVCRHGGENSHRVFFYHSFQISALLLVFNLWGTAN